MKKTKFERRWLRKNAQQKHFRARVTERFDIELDVSDWTQLLEDILTERATPLARPSLQTSFWKVEIQGQPVVVVFNHETLEMVTAITEEMWEQRKLARSQRLTASLGDTLGKVLGRPDGS